MKDVKKRFSESAHSKMSKCDAELVLQDRRIDDLKYLRDVVSNGKMSPALYDFLNVDGSMSTMFGCLPIQGDTACEALNTSQAGIIDELIATEEMTKQNLIVRMWNAFYDWITNFLDANAFALRSIRRIRARLSQTNRYFGDLSTMDSMVVSMFTREEFLSMVKSVNALNQICRSIPNDVSRLQTWYEVNKPNLDTHLADFGKYIDESNNVITGTPKYIIQSNTCIVLGWKSNILYNDIVAIENAIGNEIDTRRTFNTMYRLFTQDPNADAKVLSTVKKMVIACKECSLFIGRRAVRFFQQLENAHLRNYRIR